MKNPRAARVAGVIRRALPLALLLLVTVVAAGGQPEPPLGTDAPVPREQLPAVHLDQPPPAGAGREFVTDFARATIDFAPVISGGPPKDGIPAIDRPRFISSEEATRWLDPREPVLVVEGDVARRAVARSGAGSSAASEPTDEVHIYPLQVLMWHEIVNDEVGGVPVTVTYCPLCNTGVAFLRDHYGAQLSFGTTGRLRFSNLLMYDRETESWWQQASGEAVAGFFAGTRLAFVPVVMTSFADARGQWPEARVLSRETGFNRSYGSNPYAGYDSLATPFLLRGAELGPAPVVAGPDGPAELRLLDRVISLELGGESIAIAYLALEEARVVTRTVGGERIVVLWEPGTASALDARRIADGADVGSANAFFARLRSDGSPVSLRRDGERIVDEATGSEWNASGRAISGPRAGEALDPAPGVQHFWFSHAAFFGE